MTKYTATVLLTVLLCSCSADHRARNIIAEYKAAVEKHDESAISRLTCRTMRDYIDQQYFNHEKAAAFIDEIMKAPVRTLRGKHAVAYVGWVPTLGEQRLFAVLVGEPNTINTFAALRDHPSTDKTDWQLSMVCDEALGAVRTEAERPRVNDKLANVDEQLLTAVLFEGDNHAKHALADRLQ